MDQMDQNKSQFDKLRTYSTSHLNAARELAKEIGSDVPSNYIWNEVKHKSIFNQCIDNIGRSFINLISAINRLFTLIIKPLLIIDWDEVKDGFLRLLGIVLVLALTCIGVFLIILQARMILYCW